MMCEKCKKKPAASILRIESTSGHSYTVALCDDCKKTFDYSASKKYTQKSSPNIFSNPKIPNKCTRCGTSLEELISGKSPFCPECYSSFGTLLSEYMLRLHGSYTHKGKHPARDETSNTHFEDVNSNQSYNPVIKLNEELTSAIRDERYEDAARIRDEIKYFHEGDG